jgi:crotonobetainyl-CoA:carnitine CoA-transferase CaiB-like acyl-CoA transferase
VGGSSAQFAWANRNKRGLALDLKTAAGREVALALADRADVLVENYASGAMDRLGLGAVALEALNPRLIYCSICGYAREGELAARPGLDPVVQAEAGMMSLTGHADREGVRTGSPVADLGAGFLAASAVLAALYERQQSGRGQTVTLSLFDTAVNLVGPSLLGYLANGQVPVRNGNGSREAAPTDAYRAADGPLYIACPSDALFKRLVETVLEAPELATDARFFSNTARMANRDSLRTEIESRLQHAGCEVWAHRLRDAGIPVGVMRDIAAMAASTELKQRALVQRLDDASFGTVPTLNTPYRFSRSPKATARRAPLHGEHAAEVLSQLLDCTPEQRDRWVAQGAFGTAVAAPGPGTSALPRPSR